MISWSISNILPKGVFRSNSTISYRKPRTLSYRFRATIQSLTNCIDFRYRSSTNGVPFIPQINQDNAHVTIVFLSQNSVASTTPIDDPWYATHSHPLQFTQSNPYPDTAPGSSSNGTLYFRDHPISVLGCAEQSQICNPNLPANRSCMSLSNDQQVLRALGGLHMNDLQTAAAQTLVNASYQGGYLEAVVNDLGNSALLARQSLNIVQSPLPSDQWTLEVESCTNIVLAEMQRTVLEYATGPSDLSLLPFLVRPTTAAQKTLCSNQKARSGNVQNFSVLAVIIILVFGLMIICINLWLDTIIGNFQQLRIRWNHRRLAWKSNGFLQMQRMAHEECGYGDWEGCTNLVLVTHTEQMLAGLDVSNSDHPRLNRQRTSPRQTPQITTEMTQVATSHLRQTTRNKRSNPAISDSPTIRSRQRLDLATHNEHPDQPQNMADTGKISTIAYLHIPPSSLVPAIEMSVTESSVNGSSSSSSRRRSV